MTTHLPKSLLCLLLAICLLPALPVTAAEATQPDQLFGSLLMDALDSIRSTVVMEGAIYCLTEKKALYTWASGDQEMRRVALIPPADPQPETTPAVGALLVYEDKLMGLDVQNGILYTLSIQPDSVTCEKPLKLDWTPFQRGDEPHTYIVEPSYLVAHQGRLYAGLRNYENLPVDLYSYDMQTGRIQQHGATHLQSLVPYKDGQLLGIRHNQREEDSEGNQLPPQVVVLNPRDNSLTPLPLGLPALGKLDSADSLGLCWDAQEDLIYLSNDSSLMRLSDKQEPVVTDRIPMGGTWSQGPITPRLLPLDNRQMLVGFGWNLFFRSTDESKLKPAVILTMNEMPEDPKALVKALLAMPHVQVEVYKGAYMDQQTINLQLITGTLPFDLLNMDTAYYDLQTLMQKGYLAELSQDEHLERFANSLFDLFTPAIRLEGKLYALPTRLDSHYMTIPIDIMEEMQLKAPASIPELLDLVRWWAEEGHTKYPDYTLISTPDIKFVLKDLAFSSYTAALQGQNKPLYFDMQGFGSLMQQIDALDTTGWNMAPEEFEQDYGSSKIGILEPYAGYQFDMLASSMAREQIIILSPDETLPALRPVHCWMMAVPATSKHPREAVEFLSHYIRNLEPVTQASLRKDWTQPIEDPNYDLMMAGEEQDVAAARQRAEKASGAEKTEAEQYLQHALKRMERNRQAFRYTVSPESLKLNHQLMEKFFISTRQSLLEDAALSKDGYLFNAYTEGALTLEQFIQQANDKIRLMTLESQ
jgi:hypothetical protein